jgi:hypothetical protein
MISLDVKIQESLDRDNLLLCKAIIVACTCFEYWLITCTLSGVADAHLYSPTISSMGVKVLLRSGSAMW